MLIPKTTSILTLSCALVLGQACDSTPPKPSETQTSRVDGEAVGPTPGADESPKSRPGGQADTPDLVAALAVAVEHGVVPPRAGGSTYQVDPFVLAWIVAAVENGGDRWLTRYEAADSGGALVKGWQVRVPPDSPLASLGLRDGDVVEKVARVEASDISRVKLAVARADNELSLTVYRVDVSLTLSYRVEPGLAWTRAR
ncbi:MAG: hypothetical protein JKY37_23865, partial [Nannocystaceae bacterium]|nr:hypothetical protein [Nannocystaceae bacterium]